MAGNDTFVILPTGNGIYPIIIIKKVYVAGCNGSIVIVITPLVALMIDQTKRFQGREVQLVYISPENILMNHRFCSMICGTQYQDNLKALVVDEAHCIKLW